MSPQLVFLLLLAAPAPATPPPDGPTRREAAALADPKLTADGVEAAAEDDSPLVLSPWRHRPGTWIAFLPDIGEDDPHPATLHLAVIARAGQRWVAIARADETRTDGDDVPRGTRSYTLDLAPFRLSDTEVALGVRERAEYTYPPEAETSEDLLLYRASGGRLVRVLTVDTLYDWNDPNRDVIMGTDTAVVAVSKNKTAGFFDLVVTAHREAEKPRKLVTTYVWTGERYEKRSTPKR